MKMIEIKNNAKYNGRDMQWTETQYGKCYIGTGTILYHFSNSKISAFKEDVETCFFFEKRSVGHCYAFIAKREVELADFGAEARCMLFAKDFDCFYIGKRKYMGKGVVEDHTEKIED